MLKFLKEKTTQIVVTSFVGKPLIKAQLKSEFELFRKNINRETQRIKEAIKSNNKIDHDFYFAIENFEKTLEKLFEFLTDDIQLTILTDIISTQIVKHGSFENIQELLNENPTALKVSKYFSVLFLIDIHQQIFSLFSNIDNLETLKRKTQLKLLHSLQSNKIEKKIKRLELDRTYKKFSNCATLLGNELDIVNEDHTNLIVLIESFRENFLPTLKEIKNKFQATIPKMLNSLFMHICDAYPHLTIDMNISATITPALENKKVKEKTRRSHHTKKKHKDKKNDQKPLKKKKHKKHTS